MIEKHTQSTTSAKAPRIGGKDRANEWKQAARDAAGRIPPLWPLKHFVAVNPFLEMIDQPFARVASRMARAVPGGILIEREFFARQREEGVIGEAHLQRALLHLQERGGLPLEEGERLPTLPELEDWLVNDSQPMKEAGTLAHAIDKQHGSRWSSEVVEEISHWLGAYLDVGQALWGMPWKDKPLFEAWRRAAMVDRNPEILGLKDFRRFVLLLPERAEDAIVQLLGIADVKVEDTVDWLHRELLSVGGWASCLQYRKREGTSEDGPLDLLAIRLAFDVALLRQYDSPELRSLWRKQVLVRDAEADRRLQLHLVWQEAFELAYRETLVDTLPSTTQADSAPSTRPLAQMVFCIDVRSEPMRRAIEDNHPEIETFGFAGFFGMPIEKVPFAKPSGAPHCPVILDPPFRVREGSCCDDEAGAARLEAREKGLAGLWKGFKESAVSCFSFVEAAGLGYSWSLLRDSFLHHGKREAPAFKPMLDAHHCEHAGECGIPFDEQVNLAKGVVKALNLDKKAGRLVALCGHGASTKNNPYDSGLQCGACGGHCGDFNSRLAAELLNRQGIRKGLADAGMGLPEDTYFLAGRHDTTLDEISFFDEDAVPDSHHADLAGVKETLGKATILARRARAPQLGINGKTDAAIARAISERAGDWSQVRPEWGLAGNAAFIVGPRERSQDLDLKGRAFLHHYRSEEDADGSLLATILGGPLVVGSWINLQYYASCANHKVFGSGHKTLHNVNGTHGVQLGNGGDLKSGLPLQSVHDGEKWAHEPVRLHVFVDAPAEKVEAAVDSNATVKDLVQNRWVHLFAASGDGGWLALN